MIYYNILIVILSAILVSTRPVADPPVLFGMDEKMDKLVIKNQIGYHFKKVVKEVSQELFVSRKIDVSLIFMGINVLKKTETEIRRLCDRIPDKIKGANMQHNKVDAEPKVEPYILIQEPYHASFKEAKAKCTALGMQLPEVYTFIQKETLTKFLEQRAVSHCHAGIEHDMVDSIQRHIATQFPIWKTAYPSLHNLFTEGIMDLKYSLDDAHVRFAYTKKGTLGASLDSNTVINAGQIGSHTFRETNHELSQLLSRIVCEPKWNGSPFPVTLINQMNQGGINVVSRYSRSINSNKTDDTSISDTKSIQTLCHSVADQARESHTEMYSKLKDLLALVDISVHTSVTSSEKRKKRVATFIAKFVFVTGVKLLWQLFGFVQKVKKNNRLKKLETRLQGLDDRSLQNSDAIVNMTRLIYGNSVAISQLNIRVDNIEVRLAIIEKQVETLWEKFSSLSYKFEAVNSLIIIENLISRTRQSMESGYATLKDIIHHTKLGQTSPLVLPMDQMILVQNEISQVSTAILDPDFAKMQSIVVSDPQDPTLLLVVVNMAALSRRNLELVKMVPVPYFEDKVAYEISLDYDTIVLDQSSYTFSILTEQEEYDCIFNRCYVSSMEQSLLERSCGIPQFYDHHKDTCVAEKVESNGVFLKPMLPDGVIFAFEGEVRSQVFRKDKPVGSTRQLKGTGILQLPNGCVLSVMDAHGKITRVKGQPQYTMVTTQDIELMPNGPLTAMYTEMSSSNTKKETSVNAYVEEHVSTVVRQINNVDSKIENQHFHVWILTAVISVIFLLSMLTVCLLYRYSTRARVKIRGLKHNFADISQQLLQREVRRNAETRDGAGITLSPVRTRRDAMISHLREERRKALILKADTEGSISSKQDRSYASLSEIADDEEEVCRYAPQMPSGMSTFRPIKSPKQYAKEYPRIDTPMLKEAAQYEDERLLKETKLTQEFCETTSPKLKSKIDQ